MEAAERQWKEKLVEAVRKATEDENDSSSENVSMNPLPSATVPSIPSTIPTNLPPVSGNPPPSTNPQNVYSFHFSNLQKGGYSYPLPSNHPFVATSLSSQSTPKRTTVPMDMKSPSFTLMSTSTLPTQTLSSSTTRISDTSSLSFESVLNDVLRQANELRQVVDYYERQD